MKNTHASSIICFCNDIPAILHKKTKGNNYTHITHKKPKVFRLGKQFFLSKIYIK